MKKILLFLIIVSLACMWSVARADENVMTDSGEVEEPSDGESMTDPGEERSVSEDGSFMNDPGEAWQADSAAEAVSDHSAEAEVPQKNVYTTEDTAGSEEFETVAEEPETPETFEGADLGDGSGADDIAGEVQGVGPDDIAGEVGGDLSDD